MTISWLSQSILNPLHDHIISNALNHQPPNYLETNHKHLGDDNPSKPQAPLRHESQRVPSWYGPSCVFETDIFLV